MDDLQSVQLYNRKTSYDDVINFIERTYDVLKDPDITFWCAVDEGQSVRVSVDNEDVTHLHHIVDTQFQLFGYQGPPTHHVI